MRYIKPEIEIAEIQAEDVITLSLGDILGWGEMTPEEQSKIDSMVDIGSDGSGNANVDVNADFFN